MTTSQITVKQVTSTSTYIRDPRQRLFAHVVWAIIVLLTWALFNVALVVRFDEAREISPEVEFGANQLSALEAQALADLGWSIDVYAWYLSVIGFLIVLVFSVVGVTIFWRRSGDWMAIFVSLALITFAAGSGQAMQSVATNQPDLRLLAKFIQSLGFSSFIGLLCLFPDGRVIPRWTRFLIAVWTIYVTLVFFTIENPWRSQSIYLSGVLGIGAGAGAQIYRYRRVSGSIHKQQTKWIVLGLAAMVIGNVLRFLMLLLMPSFEQSGLTILALRIVGYILAIAPEIVMGLTIGFSILRYRLYDIDLILNRSLVYGMATLLLGVMFVAGVLTLRAVFGQEQSGIALGVSLAGAGALFNPARKQAQHLIDRRLYRFRFDLDELAQAQQAPDVKNPGALTGRNLGGYQVLGVLGRGGMGEVYKATGNGQFVAIKILPADLALQENFRKRFEREAQTLSAFNHPNIVKVYGFGESDGVYYMALEFVDGRELGDIIHENGRLTLETIQPFMADFAAGLDYAHSQGFVHRDIKPSNIMVRLKADNETQEVVLMDFGIAKIQDAQTEITGTGAIGTIDYMAPEQIMAAREVDFRADIYALGVVAYQMLTGELPFKGGHPGQVLFAHLQQPPPDPRAVVTDLPESTASAVMKAMAKKPEERFETVSAMAGALQG